MTEEKRSGSDMMQRHIQELLKHPPRLFKNFHYDDVLAFIQTGVEISYAKDDIIIREDEQVNAAYLVASGSLSVWKEDIRLKTLGEKDFLGETYLFSKNNRIAKITSDTPSILLKFDRYNSLNYFSQRPEKLFNIFTKNIIEIQQEKISNMNSQLFALKKQIADDK
ncbi:MAG: cyclic nucleotide-binding domain-containing protein [Bacteroidetes bacterium]|jgi:CRP-like cAMP-binding protein|nr:cyclic nucleotide-binding domain-containing protein [Bacteroidota bacterium]